MCTQRADHIFFKKLGRIQSADPKSVRPIYELLLSTLKDLGIQRCGIRLFTEVFHPVDSYGNVDLCCKFCDRCYHTRIRRFHINKHTSVVCIPIHFGYAPPIILTFIYDSVANKNVFPSIASVIRMLYYSIRCMGVVTALQNKDKFLLQFVQERKKGASTCQETNQD